MEKVVLGMSGGVDSALAALELKNAGYEVSGLYIDFHGFSEGVRAGRQAGDRP